MANERLSRSLFHEETGKEDTTRIKKQLLPKFTPQGEWKVQEQKEVWCRKSVEYMMRRRNEA